MSSGSINSGPLLIRIADTYLFSSFLNPVPSNYLLVTSENGLLVPSNKIYVSSLAVSSCNASSITGSTILVNNITASTISTGNLYYSSLQANNVNVSTLRACTINLTNLTLSTFIGSTVTFNETAIRSTLTTSTLQGINVSFSTLTGSTINPDSASALVLTGSTMNISQLSVSTLIGSTLAISTLTASSIQGRALVYSTLGGSTMGVSSMTGSTIDARNAYVSTLGGSTVTANVISVVSTLTGSTINGTNVTASSLTTNTLTMNRVTLSNAMTSVLLFSTAQGSSLVTSTLSVSTMYGSSLSFSTMTGSTVLLSSVIGSSVSADALTVSTMSGITLTTSTALVSSMTAGWAGFSTMVGSTVSITTAGVSLMNGSTMFMNSGSFSTYQGSTLLVSSMVASTLLVANVTFSTARGNTTVFSTANVSSNITGSAVTSALQGSTITISTLTGSTLYMNMGVFSTMTGSSLLVSTALISSLYSGPVIYSTLSGNALTVSSMDVPVTNVNQLNVSTINGSTANVSTLVVSTLGGFSTLAFSTLSGSTVVISSLAGSSVNGGTIVFSTITESNVVSNTIVATSVFASSIQFTNLNPMNIYGSTMTMNSMSALLTLSASTISTINLTYSTIVVATTTMSNSMVSAVTVSSLIANEVSATTYSVRHPVSGATVKKTSISYPNPAVMKTSGIRAILDGTPSGTQTYTFGPTVPNRWIAGFNTTNTLAYSNDGLNWIGLGTTLMNLGRIAMWNGSMWVAVGSGANSIAYSYNGINWTGLGIDTFASANDVAWNGSMWVAVGSGFHAIAYSYDGINWTGLGRFIFTIGWGVAWNGTMWIAVGEGFTPIAYSIDGINWTGAGIAIFTRSIGVAWNGTIWVAMGEGTNSIAYSADGIVWTGLGVTIFTLGIGVAWNGIMWVASGQGANTLAYSYDGITWIGLGTSFFTFVGRKLAWNGTMWIAGGSGLTNTLAYSNNGINWVRLPMDMSSDTGYSTSFNVGRPHRITFPASMLVATGSGTNTLAYSSDGITWTGSGTSIFSTQGNGVATNGSIWVATGSGTNTLAYSTTDIETPFIHVPFENSIYADVMGNSTVTATGSPAFVSGVRGSKAVNLANTAGSTALQYIRGTWDGANNITVSLWLNPQTLLSGTGQIELFMAYNGGYNVYINGTNNVVFVTNGMIITSSATLLTNAWYNIVAIGQVNGLCSLYLDNFLVGTATNSGGFGASTGFFGLGTTDTSTPLYAFNGYIDDFRLYNYAIRMNQRITWRGLGSSVFSVQGNAVAWNGMMWVAVGGNTTHSIAYSYDGITWIGLGNSIFTTGHGVTWGGSMWVAVGNGLDHSIAYSYNGITWVGLGKNTFSGNGKSVAWNGSLWVAVGSGANSIAYSYDGVSWVGLGIADPFFNGSGNSVAWNGSRWVATGAGGNTILYSADGITWTVVTTSCFTTSGNGVTWNGSRWIIVGSGGNTIGYSMDGSTWTFNQSITPNKTDVADWTWTNNGITWTASASTEPIAEWRSYNAFDNSYDYNTDTDEFDRWSTLGSSYDETTGVYAVNDSSTDVLAGIGTIYAEWLQIQSSTPLRMYSYAFAAGLYQQGLPNTYYIVGSNDGTNWYPIQRCVMSVNPLTAGLTAYSTDITVNQSGTQTISGGITGSGTFTTYPSYTTQTYTYFRLIIEKIWGEDRSNAEIGEWYINFNCGGTYTINGYSSSIINPFTDAGSGIASNNGLPGVVSIQHPVVAVGSGAHSLAYSPDGVQWTGLGTTIFSAASCVAWNGSKWLACGTGTHTLAYSYDGLRWTGLGSTIFFIQANGVAWNGSMWVAVGNGGSSIAYSDNGVEWKRSGTGTTIFTNCRAVAWNGVQWVAVGTGTNSIAYSFNGIQWTAVSSTIFSTQGNGVCWTGSLWVAVGAGTNSIAYSSDGITWTGLGTNIFSTSGNGVCWNGSRWVAVGSGTNTLAYSANGTSWIGFGTGLFSVAGNGVCWTGTRFVAVGSGSNPIGYSTDGLTWYSASSSIFTQGNGVAGNSRLGATVCDSQVALYDSTTLDVTSDRYYNTGYTEMSATIQSQTPTVDTTTIAVLLITVPGAPTDVLGALYPAGVVDSIDVSFTYTTDTGGDIVTYFVNAIDTLGVQPTVVESATTSPVNLTDLVPGTTYRIQVYSSNSAGQSVPAVFASSLLFQVPPSVPQNYSVILDPPSDPTGVAVSFTAPAISGGITSYTVTAYQGVTTISTQTGTALSYTFTGLTPGTAYRFSAVGTNAGGIGTSIDSSITYLTKPGAPTDVSGALYPAGTANSIDVSFVYPTSTGGEVVTYFASAIDILGVQPTVVKSTATSPVNLTDLVPGTTYRLQVYSSNSIGQSVAAVSASNLLFQVPPSVPQNYSVALDPPSDPTGVAVSFTAPAISGGITSYTVTAYQGVTQVGSAQIGTALSYTFTGLTPGTVYRFSAMGTNTGGIGTSVDDSITYLTKPGAPTDVSGALYPAGAANSIDVSFTNTTNTGGDTVTYFASAIDILGVQPTVVESAMTSPINLTGLAPGTTYQLQVYSSNSIGQSVATVSASTLLFQVPPSVPQNYSVALDPPSDPTGIAVSFTAPEISGGITSYTVTAYEDVTLISTQTGTSLSYTFTELTPGTAYRFSAVGTNTGGTGTSIDSSITYLTTPGAPTDVSGALYPAGAVNSIDVSFSNTTNTGGATVTYFASAIDILGVQPTVVKSTATSPVNLTGLVPGTTYQFQVYSSNSAYQSAPTVSASNLLFQVPPSAPQNYSVALDPPSDPTGIAVSFTAPAISGGITSYTVTCYDQANTVIGTQTGTALSYKFTGLIDGSRYNFSTVSTNAGGIGTAINDFIYYVTKPAQPVIIGVLYNPPNIFSGTFVSFTTTDPSNNLNIQYRATVYSSSNQEIVYSYNSISGLFDPDDYYVMISWVPTNPGETYTFRIVAYNQNLASDESNTFVSTYYIQPSVPRSVSATPGIENATISWQAPTNNGGSTVTYRVISTPAAYDSGTAGLTSTSVTATGLTGRTSYTFTITATNLGGLSNSATSSSITILFNTLAPFITLEIPPFNRFNFNLRLFYDFTFDRYSINEYQYSTDNGTSWTTTNVYDIYSNPYLSVPKVNIIPDTTVRYVVRVHHAPGWSPISNIVSHYYPPLPPAPTITLYPSRSSTTITWVFIPEYPNRASIIYYECTVDNGDSWFEFGDRTSDSAVLPYIFEDITFTFGLRAHTESGPGPASNMITHYYLGLPPAPTITVQQGELNALITWSFIPEYANYASIDQYEYSIDNGTSWTAFGDVTSTNVSITGIIADTTALFVIRAHNEIGWGPASNTVSRYYPTLPPAPTIEVQTYYFNARINWAYISRVDRYEYSIDNGTSWIASEDLFSVTIYDIARGTNAQFVVRAHNISGWGPASNMVSHFYFDVNSPIITVQPGELNALITWSFSLDYNGGPIDQYAYSIDNGTSWITFGDEMSTEILISDIVPGTTAQFVIRIYTGMYGWSGASNMVSYYYPLFPPAPTITVEVGDSTAVINITFDPEYDRASIDQYEYSIDNGTLWTAFGDGTSTNVTITGILGGTTAQFVVRAHNTDGWGPTSNMVSHYYPALPPAPIIAVQQGELNGLITWSFIPEYDRASIDQYAYSVDNDISWITFGDGTSTEVLVSNILPDTNARFVVRVHNADGWGPASNVVSYYYPLLPPAPIIQVQQGELNALITWSFIPEYDRASIDQYEYSIDNGTLWTAFGDGTSTNVSITGIIADTTAQFVVRAHNLSGWGPASNMVSYYYPLLPPAPTITVQPGELNALITWSFIPEYDRASIDQYEYSIDNGISWTAFGDGTSNDVTITGILADTTALFVIRVHNVTGWGPASNMVSHYYLGLPPAPTITVQQGELNALIAWSFIPYYVARASIDQYAYSFDNGTSWTAFGDGTSSEILLSNIVADTTALFVVRAHNEVGWGPASNMVSYYYPVLPPAPTIEVQPTELNALVTWSFIPEYDRASIDQYAYSIDNATSWITFGDGTSNDVTITGIVADTTALFVVRVHNVTGWGPASNMVSHYYPALSPAPIIQVEYGELNAVIMAEIPAEYDRTLIDRYEYSIDNGASWIVPITVFDETIRYVMYISGIVANTTAQIVVRAHNVSGWSPASNMVSKYYPPLPTVPTITLSPTTPTVYIQWSPDPAYVASVLIDEYAYSIDNGTSWTSFGDRNSYNLIIYNLVQGTTSMIVIRAYNASGWGPSSNMISYYYAPPTTDISIELQPFVLVANIIATFAPNYDVYAIDLAEYSIDNGNSWTIIDGQYGSVQDFYIFDIVPDTTIQVIVRVHNMSGSNSVSNMVSYYYPPAAGYYADNQSNVLLTETMTGDPNFPMVEATASILLAPESWFSTLRVGSCRIIYHVGGVDVTINGREVNRDPTTLYIKWEYPGPSLYDADFNQTMFTITLVASNQYGGTDTLYIPAELAPQ